MWAAACFCLRRGCAVLPVGLVDTVTLCRIIGTLCNTASGGLGDGFRLSVRFLV